ncbi:DUF4384 domain-containing protein [candidate division KSB1 bacterium]|nr:DUF4384 domain-containing protein [candidate division KSB1 bacterium]NIR71879.1 DUF4384 domain-containing protein [candidate division KSB1 bacterium]NIS26446.1 DUF4384 domain-containing protein [candidate division KSB1 bacterium]NIT73216.1 DUF4384 domain-containing protein [candidate division KSB1 bacterium]NIU27130.1 DUF4384 domain-containing protein [candidate division KSB1 bacterium]
MHAASLQPAQVASIVSEDFDVQQLTGFAWLRSTASDKLRIYVAPKADCFVYVVYSDEDTLALLNSKYAHSIIEKDSTLILPSAVEYYQVDGVSSVELFTVICSPKS